MKISILIVDDHLLFRVGVRSVLIKQPDIKVVAEASNHKEAIEAFKKHSPDIVILDLRMPGLGGFDVLRDIQAVQQNVKVLVLSSFANEEEIYRAMTLGTKGYLLKDAGSEELLSAVRAIFNGKLYFPPSIKSIVASRSATINLTARELEVLSLLVKGLTNREIASILGTSQNTIRNQTISIFAKLEVTDRTEAVVTALQRGIVIPTA